MRKPSKSKKANARPIAVRRGARAKRSTDPATEAIGDGAAAAQALLDQRDSGPADAQQHIVEAPSEEVLFPDQRHEGGRPENEDVERGD